MRIQSVLKRLHSERGSLTLEATLVFPAVFIACILLLFMSLLVFHKASLFQSAAMTAERSAYVWDNSRKDPVTGQVALGQRDGLYWRLSNDHALHLFSLFLPVDPVRVTLPSDRSLSPDDSPAGKLLRAAAPLPERWEGTLQYSNRALLRKVEVFLAKPFHAPSYGVNALQADKVRADASSHVVDPVELIRLTDLTRTFIQEVQGRIKPNAARSLMSEPVSVPKEPQVIASHAQAAEYLRALVGGKAKKLQVKPGTMREIDALDGNGVAHQAYYTFTEKQLREVQLPKDAELLRQGGEVKGVVWHFFKTGRQSKIALSDSLKRELQRAGIVVIVHE